VLVMSFLLVLAAMFSNVDTWKEISSGFFKFGNIPILRAEDANGNGKLDPGEDWDSDGRLDVIEPSLQLVFDTEGNGKRDATDVDANGHPDRMVNVQCGAQIVAWPDLNGDGEANETVTLDSTGDGQPNLAFPLDREQDGKLDRFVDVDDDGTRDGGNLDNVFLALLQGRPLPTMDYSIVGFLCALIAISGNGGSGNSAVSNYTREQGWGHGGTCRGDTQHHRRTERFAFARGHGVSTRGGGPGTVAPMVLACCPRSVGCLDARLHCGRGIAGHDVADVPTTRLLPG